MAVPVTGGSFPFISVVPSLVSIYGWLSGGPPTHSGLHPQTCGCGAFHGRGMFADVIELGCLGGRVPSKGSS